MKHFIADKAIIVRVSLNNLLVLTGFLYLKKFTGFIFTKGLIKY